ncbi:RNA polymerase III transcription factor IIIC subunit-domain-containing protein [Cadophora sp. MPI-SDFR-AT-0126]|nr:RNA polymerase III transcription factor IIIC subunit-domain-containing protein [Leotiomycetes sp. MPI-SDFR-AT-0126]
MSKLNRGPARPKQTQAPIYKIAPREITAVEHPLIIQNLDNGLKTFGTNKPFERIMNSIDPEECVPLYLRHNDPMCVPILSHNAPTNNVLLKITVPKRTGRKRKRGSQDPYEFSNAPETTSNSATSGPPAEIISSVSRMDEPSQILRKMKDNVNKYKVEAVGEIRQSHRYRGMSDFHQSTSNTEFIPRFKDTVLTGRIEDIRRFKLDERRGWKPNEHIIPPPIMSSHALPFNWGWHQAAHLSQEQDNEGNRVLINHSKPEKGGVIYLGHDVEEIPTEPDREEPTDEAIQALIVTLKEAMKERPIWTRRSLLNRVGSVPGIYQFKQAIPFVGYQFKGGPWRDALIKFGVDPRTDPRYRQYQTFFFQFNDEAEKLDGEPWRDNRQNFNLSKEHGITHTTDDTHVFDGKKLTLDGKIWQVCDITVPLLVNLMEDAPYRDKCEILTDGWYCNGTIAKFKGIMKTKLVAVKARREVADSEFEPALAVPDIVPDKLSKLIPVPLPDLGLSQNALDDMTKEVPPAKDLKAKRKYVRKAKTSAGGDGATPDTADTSAVPTLPSPSPAATSPIPNNASQPPPFTQQNAPGKPSTSNQASPLPIPVIQPPSKDNYTPPGNATDSSTDEPMDDALDHFESNSTPHTPHTPHTPGTALHDANNTTPGIDASNDEDDEGDVDEDDDMDSEDERNALASDLDDDEDEGDDYFSDAVEHQRRRSGDEVDGEDEDEG